METEVRVMRGDAVEAPGQARGLRRWVALALLAAVAVSCARAMGPTPVETLEQYVVAVNRYDVEAVRDMTAEDAVWILGPDTLRGRDEMMGPIAYDEGAKAVLTVSDVAVRGDTVECGLSEKNDVLASLGVPELHRRIRMVARGGLIHSISPVRPATEQQAVADTMKAFMDWLRTERPDTYALIWSKGGFNYSLEVGEQMPNLIRVWRHHRND